MSSVDLLNQQLDGFRKDFQSLRSEIGKVVVGQDDIVEGTGLGPMIERLLAVEQVSYLHLHNAQRGCYLASAVRE